MSAVQAVLHADIKNINLIKQEQEILNKLDIAEDNETVDKLLDLEKITNELNSNNIELLEPRARKILSG